LKKKLASCKKILTLLTFTFTKTEIKDNKMSGLVQWSSCAKRKAQKKSAKSKPNARRQRVLAFRRRKIRQSAAKAAVRMPAVEK